MEPGDGRASLADYWRCTRDLPNFRLLLIGGAVDLVGSWLTQVAVMLLLETAASGSGLAVAAINLCRVVPALLLAPVAGGFGGRSRAASTNVQLQHFALGSSAKSSVPPPESHTHARMHHAPPHPPTPMLCCQKGAVADRCNRVKVLVYAALVGAAAAASMPAVMLLPKRGPTSLVLLYCLLVVQVC